MITSRWVRAGAALVAALAVLPGCAAPARAGEPAADRASVAQGELRGRTDGDVVRFEGVPFAAPPVGELRFAPPRDPAPWTGLRDATAPGPRCVQPPSALSPQAPAGSAEDCLTLSVTRPTEGGDRLPVLVWVHGGGFSTGAGSDYDPAALAGEGLVVVTVNYRLGALGFLGLPGLPGSGSFALQDQQAALRWVRDNIAAFGGDPAAVTLAGESAGADAVCSQLASPGAAGLFARAVVQSGSCHDTNVTDVILPGAGPAVDTWKPLPLVEQAGLAAAAGLGCPDPATALQCLRALPAEALLGAAGTYWSPAVGTPTLPERPSATTATGAGVPVLTGTTDDEGAFFAAAFFVGSGNSLDEAGFTGLLGLAAGPRTPDALAAYPLAGRTPDRAWADVITDRGYACPNLATYDRWAAGGAVYAFEFADPAAPAPFGPVPAELRRGAPHGSDVPSLFDLPAAPDATADPGLAGLVRGYWARFAATGDPNGADAPRWDPVGTDGPVLRLAPGDVRPVPAADLAAAHRCALWT